MTSLLLPRIRRASCRIQSAWGLDFGEIASEKASIPKKLVRTAELHLDERARSAGQILLNLAMGRFSCLPLMTVTLQLATFLEVFNKPLFE